VGGPVPVHKEGVEHDVYAERVVEEVDLEAATADLQTASVVELTEESSIVHEGDKNIWRPGVRGRSQEIKDVVEQLKALTELRVAGALTDEEFERKKKELLG